MLKLEDVTFLDGESVHAVVYKLFEVEILRSELDEISEWEIKDGKLVFPKLGEERSDRRVLQLLRKKKTQLKYKLNSNPAIYVDEDLGLPLIGLNFLGLVDKGSEIIEVKPITNCNADCNFCSVNEGPSSDKQVDFVVDLDYLIAETNALLEFKEAEKMQLWLNPHGEPTLYPKLVEYCEVMLANPRVSKIHIISNGMLLLKSFVDKISEISKKEGKEIGFSISMSGISQDAEEKSKLNKEGLSKDKLLMGKSYNLNLVVKNLAYAVKKVPITITPVLVSGMNDEQMQLILDYAKDLSKESKQAVEVMIQKFCKNKYGRNPIKEGEWDPFYDILKDLEEKNKVDLTKPLGRIQHTKELPLEISKGDKIRVKILGPSRYRKDRIGVFESKNGPRAVCLLSCFTQKGEVNVKVIQAKHNMVLAR